MLHDQNLGMAMRTGAGVLLIMLTKVPLLCYFYRLEWAIV